MRQPGEPASSSFAFENPGDEQVLGWILTAENGAVASVRLALDDRAPLQLPVRLEAGWSLRYFGGPQAVLHDPTNRPAAVVPVAAEYFRVASGRHTLEIDASLDPPAEAVARLEIRPRGRERTAGE